MVTPRHETSLGRQRYRCPALSDLSSKYDFHEAAHSITRRAMAEESEAPVLWELAVVLPCLAPSTLAPLNSPQDVKRPRWRPEINETRLYASSPPYLDVAIVFYIFVRAGVVRYFGSSQSDGLDAGRNPRRHSHSNHAMRVHPNVRCIYGNDSGRDQRVSCGSSSPVRERYV